MSGGNSARGMAQSYERGRRVRTELNQDARRGQFLAELAKTKLPGYAAPDDFESNFIHAWACCTTEALRLAFWTPKRREVVDRMRNKFRKYVKS